jgi:hypothetical protein
MTDTRVRAQPGFCPVCGADNLQYGSVDSHLKVVHGMDSRTRYDVNYLTWRELQVALLGVTPQWSGP